MGGVALLYQLPNELISGMACLSRSQLLETTNLLMETIPNENPVLDENFQILIQNYSIF